MIIRSSASRVAVAIALPAAALLGSELLRPWLDPGVEPLFIAASAIVAWLCGARYAFVSLLLSAFVFDYFFLPRDNRLELVDVASRVRFFLFLAANSIIIGLIHYARGAKAELAESEKRYRNLTELIPFGGWIADARGNMVQLSESFLKTFETTMDECQGLRWINLLDETEREQVLTEWKECVRTGYFWDYEYHLTAPSGARYVILSRGIPVHSA